MYNSLAALPQAPYKILEYLALNNENIWKMIKYNDYNALSKPNLTMKEKLDYVWKDGKQEDYSVFFTNLIEDAICESKCILKIYQYYIHARPTVYVATPVYAFDFLFGGKMSLVEYNGVPANRGDVFIHEALKTLNGVNINGIGTLTFSDDLSRYSASRAVIGNSKTYTGAVLYLSTLMGDGGAEQGCGN